MKKWTCSNCGWIYDEEKGDPASNLPPGTRWEDVPDSWVCPDCGSDKSQFEMVEV
jgi:rubredoxin-NAD+ reductase